MIDIQTSGLPILASIALGSATTPEYDEKLFVQSKKFSHGKFSKCW
jgi:hypothetical protein